MWMCLISYNSGSRTFRVKGGRKARRWPAALLTEGKSHLLTPQAALRLRQLKSSTESQGHADMLGKSQKFLKAILPEKWLLLRSCPGTLGPGSQDSVHGAQRVVVCQAKGLMEMVPTGSQWQRGQDKLRGMAIWGSKPPSTDTRTDKWTGDLSRLVRGKVGGSRGPEANSLCQIEVCAVKMKGEPEPLTRNAQWNSMKSLESSLHCWARIERIHSALLSLVSVSLTYHKLWTISSHICSFIPKENMRKRRGYHPNVSFTR